MVTLQICECLIESEVIHPLESIQMAPWSYICNPEAHRAGTKGGMFGIAPFRLALLVRKSRSPSSEESGSVSAYLCRTETEKNTVCTLPYLRNVLHWPPSY